MSAIAGLSSGGIAAFTAAWQRPDLFSRVISTIGTFVKAGLSGNSTLKEILVPDESWQFAGGGFEASGGLATSPTGDLVFADAPNHIVYKLVDGRKPAPLFPDAPAMGGQAFDRDGTLYATVPAEKKIVSIGPNGARHEVANGIRGAGITVTNSGAIVVSEPGEHSDQPSSLWLVDPAGQKTLLDSGLSSASGIAVSPDGTLLLAAEASTKWIHSFILEADNTLQDKQRYFWLHMTDIPNNSGAGDLCYDVNGNLYIATNMGIQVADRSGRVRAILPLPTPCGPVRSICFGGPGFQTLFATDGHRLYARKMNVKGYPPWAPPQRVQFRGWG